MMSCEYNIARNPLLDKGLSVRELRQGDHWKRPRVLGNAN